MSSCPLVLLSSCPLVLPAGFWCWLLVLTAGAGCGCHGRVSQTLLLTVLLTSLSNAQLGSAAEIIVVIVVAVVLVVVIVVVLIIVMTLPAVFPAIRLHRLPPDSFQKYTFQTMLLTMWFSGTVTTYHVIPPSILDRPLLFHASDRVSDHLL